MIFFFYRERIFKVKFLGGWEIDGSVGKGFAVQVRGPEIGVSEPL